MTWVPHRGTLPPLAPLDGRTPVIVLHGLLGSPGNFAPTIAGLGDVPVLAPAYGRHGTALIDDCLHELRPVFDAATLSSRRGVVDVIAHSYGALLALRLAHEFDVRTLVGVGPAWRGVAFSRSEGLRRAVGRVAGPGAVQLLRRTPFEVSEPAGTRVVSLVSSGDRVVPRASSALGEVIELPDPVRHEHLPAQAEAIVSALRWRD